jgi:hypothetical protein
VLLSALSHERSLRGRIAEYSRAVVGQLGHALADVVHGPVPSGLGRRPGHGLGIPPAGQLFDRRDVDRTVVEVLLDLRQLGGQEPPASGTVRAFFTWARMNSRVAAPASSREMVEAAISSSRPLLVCMSFTKSSMEASSAGVVATTRSGPSATMARSSSVIRVATSTITCRAMSSPVISRSIHTSTPVTLPGDGVVSI